MSVVARGVGVVRYGCGYGWILRTPFSGAIAGLWILPFFLILRIFSSYLSTYPSIFLFCPE